MGIYVFSSFWVFFIGLFVLISISTKNKILLKSLIKFNDYRKFISYVSFGSIILGFVLSIIGTIDPLNTLNGKEKIYILDLFKISIICGGLSWFFWQLHQISKFELNLPKIFDQILITLMIFLCLFNIGALFIYLKILPFRDLFLNPDTNLFLSLIIFGVPYISFIFGVNSIAKSKNRDNFGWTVLSLVLIHPIITLIIITLLGKLEKPKFK